MKDWRETLIPNVGPHHWVAMSSPKSLTASDNDTTLRPIGIVFFLEDPRARTPHVYVIVKDEKEFHLGEGNEAVNIYLDENDEGLLRAITVGVHDTSTESAFRRASAHAYSVLSLLSYQYKRPFSIQETKLNDKTHKALWTIPKFCPKAIALKVPRLAFSNESPIGSLFALFREGMNATSLAYRFLSYFKIVEGWRNNKGPFAWLIDQAKKKKLDPTFPIRTLTKDFLGGSYRPAYHNVYLNKKFTWCIDQLEDTRTAIAHPFTKESTFVNLDSPEAQAHIGALASAVERIAIQLLEDYLTTWEKLDDTGLAKEIKETYSHVDE